MDKETSKEIKIIYNYIKQLRGNLEIRIINLEEDIKNISRIIKEGT